MDINEKNYNLGNAASAIRTLYEYGKQRKQEIGEKNVFDFSIGNPSVKTPDIFTNLLKELLDDPDIHSYTSNVGDKIVRYNIAIALNKQYNANVSSNYIMMTCGAAASIAIALNGLVTNDNNEIIIFAPYFPEYKVFIENTGAKCVEIKPDLVNFEINFEDLKAKINKNTKAVIINSPNNPSGKIIEEKTLKHLASLLNDKEKEYNHPIYLISDEPYREIIHDDIAYPFITNYYNNSLVCYSYSKVLSLPGERIGYLLINPKCKDAELVFKACCGASRALGYVCAPAIFQKAIGIMPSLTSNLKQYKENRDLLIDILDECGYEYVKPQGAFYLFVKAPIDDALAFSKKALDYELLLVPSNSFGINGYVRVSYCVNKKTILNSKKAFKALIDFYR